MSSPSLGTLQKKQKKHNPMIRNHQVANTRLSAILKQSLCAEAHGFMSSANGFRWRNERQHIWRHVGCTGGGGRIWQVEPSGHELTFSTREGSAKGALKCQVQGKRERVQSIHKGTVLGRCRNTLDDRGLQLNPSKCEYIPAMPLLPPSLMVMQILLERLCSTASAQCPLCGQVLGRFCDHAEVCPCVDVTRWLMSSTKAAQVAMLAGTCGSGMAGGRKTVS